MLKHVPGEFYMTRQGSPITKNSPVLYLLSKIVFRPFTINFENGLNQSCLGSKCFVKVYKSDAVY